MSTNKSLFFKHLAQTSPAPIGLEISSAKGIYLFSTEGKKYIDLISGISVNNIGHAHPEVLKAIERQSTKHLHIMVYGEMIQEAQVNFAKTLCDQLPPSLNKVYLVNSGSEAVEGAMKLAKRYTGRTKIISFKNAYHGSTHGALSIMGNESLKYAFRPLLPDIIIIPFNEPDHLHLIDKHTSCVIIEPIQGEAGIRLPDSNFLKKIAERCRETGTLLIFDEVQTGMGRTGSLFAFMKENVIPDILILGKGIGGGMPLGAFIASEKIMDSLISDPVLGHITTFGGHPLSCAAGTAALNILINETHINNISKKEKRFRELLIHPLIKEIRGRGLLLACELGNSELNKRFLRIALDKGIVSDFFLFCDTAFRVSPPLIISDNEIEIACKGILDSLNEL